MKRKKNRVNPLLPNGNISSAKILILIGIIKQISYERRDYESVDEKSLSLSYVPKNYERKNSGSKGINSVLSKLC